MELAVARRPGPGRISELRVRGSDGPDRRRGVPLPIQALVDAAHAEAAMVRAFRERRHPEFVAEREEGREEGREQGREEGRIEAQRTILRRLASRLGPLSAIDEARIAAATAEQLEHYLDRVVIAQTLAQLFES